MYDSENCPKDIAIEAEEELDEDDKGLTILISEVVKAIKNMRRKKATGTTTYQLIYSRNWETID